jgi:hypothetical protein
MKKEGYRRKTIFFEKKHRVSPGSWVDPPSRPGLARSSGFGQVVAPVGLLTNLN